MMVLALEPGGRGESPEYPSTHETEESETGSTDYPPRSAQGTAVLSLVSYAVRVLWLKVDASGTVGRLASGGLH